MNEKLLGRVQPVCIIQKPCEKDQCSSGEYTEEQRLVMAQGIRFQQVTERQGQEETGVNGEATEKGHGYFVAFSSVRDIEKLIPVGELFDQRCGYKADSKGDEE